ncbi:cytochrome c oxidase assembly factor Coa1 family protein [Undibacterium cyanobacteriorum]|uniref:Cytochrome c oxidase assembly factor Coa1 family protein n=1 Tax=Undibacterium cyanobacteriorum TaxID=3073561 RepID=A0ABY9RLE4_9BURK|nr:cytochrome c oxidase assembly factor Coa1 family protein [Undibacterium sp. 20NA77.5]WMW82043.1 cytochrome c oxidase assembly factor Coa1 family protein [Undibacterium sp. 20NA77.5]
MTQASKPNWWSRNWKWFVPVGCLGTLVLFGGFIGALWFGITGIMKGSESYQMAVTVAKNNPKVIEVLGPPIREGSVVSGSINEAGPGGHAELQIPLVNTKGKGELYLVANKVMDKWAIQDLVLEVESTKERIKLVEATASQPNHSMHSDGAASGTAGDAGR